MNELMDRHQLTLQETERINQALNVKMEELDRVIDRAGNVLYENGADTSATENHADRAEVVAALAGKPHTVQRYSATLGHTMTYYALATTLDSGETIVIRLAVRSSEIGSFLLATLPFLLLALVLALVLSSLLAGRLSAHVSDRIGNVARSLRSLNEGKYEPLRTDSSEPEFYAVYQEINELNGKTCALLQKQQRDRERLYAVLDNMAQGMIAIDAEEKIVFANNSALRFLGGTLQDIGRPLNYLLEDPELCRRIRESGSTDVVFDYPFEAYDFTVAVRHLRDEAPSAGVAAIVILTDSTNEKKIAREKSDFFAENADHGHAGAVRAVAGASGAGRHLPPGRGPHPSGVHAHGGSDCGYAPSERAGAERRQRGQPHDL